MPTHTTCRACGKVCLRTSGFRRHIQTCKAIKKQQDATPHHEHSATEGRRRPTSSGDAYDTDYTSSSGSVVQGRGTPPSPKGRDSTRVSESIGHTQTLGELITSPEEPVNDPALPDALGLFEDLATFAITDDEDYTKAASDTAVIHALDEESVASVATSTSISFSRGRLVSAQSSNAPTIERYTDATGKLAGKALYRNSKSPSVFTHVHGFSGDVDMAFARWLQQENVSGNAINRLLADQRLGPLLDLLSWKSADEFKSRVHNMGTEVSDNLGMWQRQFIEIDSPRTETGKLTYVLRYRRVEDAVRFFLGHGGFKDELVLEPHRVWTTDEPPRRVYSDMASADWWWETQAKIAVDGATVVPLIIASDKTQVTNHQGDLAAYPVYLTIGNLPAHVRNSNDRPGTVLLALLPILKDGDLMQRSRLFHECMRVLFDPVMHAAEDGWNVPCSDGWTRRCFPIVAVMAIDHEEQVKMTGVNSRTHCTMCQVAPTDREDLEAWAPWRTHESTKAQIVQQRNSAIARSDHRWVHDVDCFAFGHKHVNIHRTMMVDVLHQLLKGVLMHTLEWTCALLEDQLPKKGGKRARKVLAESDPTRKPTSRKYKLNKGVATTLIDRRFALIPPYRNMRVFKHLSSVHQWTGKEQKSILRQMLPAFTPLLEEVGATEAIHFIRAVVDFIILALYRSHDEETLRFMNLALHRMNQHKEVFRAYRPTNPKKGEDGEHAEGHFNFPKFHAMVHYMEMIQLFGNAPDLETGHFEHKHVDYIKTPFKLTNKKPGWEDQIMEHHRRKLNMLAVFDTGFLGRALTVAEKRERTEQVVRPTGAIDLSAFYNWRHAAGHLAGKHKQNKSMWTTVSNVEEELGSPYGTHFRQAMAVFVRNQRAPPVLQDHTAARDPDTLEKDDSWVKELRLQFHPSLRCWKRTGQDPDDPEAVELDIVRCAPNWQGIEGNERYDWIWVQEYRTRRDDTAVPKVAFDGRLPARVRFIVSVEDGPARNGSCPAYGDVRMNGRDSNNPSTQTYDHNSKPRIYTGVFVDLYRPKARDGLADAVHGMTVITPFPSSPWKGTLQGRRMYDLTTVYHSIHVVPVDDDGRGDMYVNNTADFETYNTLWNPTWEADAARKAWLAKEDRMLRVQQRQRGEAALLLREGNPGKRSHPENAAYNTSKQMRMTSIQL